MLASLIHMHVGTSVQKNLENAERMIRKADETGSDFICLPEYFSIPHNLENQSSLKNICIETYDSTMRFLKRISEDTKAYIVGGTLIEQFRGSFYNTCHIFRDGTKLGSYRKMHLTREEKTLGLNRGRTLHVFNMNSTKVGILICADIFYPRTVKKLSLMGAEVIFLPVSASPTHPLVRGHPLSIERAKNNMVFILKNGNIKSNSRGGSTAAISPWGILKEAERNIREEIVSADLNLKRLRKLRTSK